MTKPREEKRMQRNIVIIEGRDFLLSQHTDMGALKAAAQQAVRDGAGFIDFVVVGNQEISVLISPGVAVLFESQTVVFDARDTGDVDHPFDPIEYTDADDPLAP